MPVFIVLETADVELVGASVFSALPEAVQCFDRLCVENDVPDEDVTPLELSGTLRIAGDDSYAVQLIQREPIDGLWQDQPG